MFGFDVIHMGDGTTYELEEMNKEFGGKLTAEKFGVFGEMFHSGKLISKSELTDFNIGDNTPTKLSVSMSGKTDLDFDWNIEKIEDKWWIDIPEEPRGGEYPDSWLSLETCLNDYQYITCFIYDCWKNDTKINFKGWKKALTTLGYTNKERQSVDYIRKIVRVDNYRFKDSDYFPQFVRGMMRGEV